MATTTSSDTLQRSHVCYRSLKKGDSYCRHKGGSLLLFPLHFFFFWTNKMYPNMFRCANAHSRWAVKNWFKRSNLHLQTWETTATWTVTMKVGTHPNAIISWHAKKKIECCCSLMFFFCAVSVTYETVLERVDNLITAVIENLQLFYFELGYGWEGAKVETREERREEESEESQQNCAVEQNGFLNFFC